MVYDYDDYRDFLASWLEAKQVRSVRGLAMRLGCSPAQVSMIRSGRRNLNLEHARHWAWGLRLDVNEARYFEALVRKEHGPTEEIRSAATREIVAAQAWRDALREEMALRVFSEWYIPAIAELARCDGFRADATWVANALVPPITVEQAQEALDTLFALELLEEGPDGVQVSLRGLSTGREIDNTAMSLAVDRMHREWLAQAGDALSDLSSNERFLGTVNVALDSNRLEQVITLLHRLHVEAADSGAEHKPDRVFQIGLCIFPRSVRVASGGE